jgi:hypothetical protein
MQLGMCTFDDPTNFSNATTVRVTAPRDSGGDVARVKGAPVLVMIDQRAQLVVDDWFAHQLDPVVTTIQEM